MENLDVNEKVKFNYNNVEYRGVVIGKYKDGKSVDVSVYGEFLSRKVLIKELQKDDTINSNDELKFTKTMNNLRALWNS